MEPRAGHFIVGLVTLMLIGIGVAFSLWLANDQLTDDRHYYRIHFRGAVTGLQPGSGVRVNGVPVGGVVSLTIDPDRPTEVVAVIAVNPDFAITDDATAQLELAGLAGGSFVQIANGHGDLAEGGDSPATAVEIRAVSSSISRLLDTAPRVVENLEEVSRQATELLSAENIDRVNGILDNAETMSASLANAATDLETLSADARETLAAVRRLEGPTREAVEEIGGTATSLRQAIDRVDGQLDGILTDVRQGVETARGAVDRAAGAVDRVADVAEQLSDGIDGTLAAVQGTMTTAGTDFTRLTDSVVSFVDDMDQTTDALVVTAADISAASNETELAFASVDQASQALEAAGRQIAALVEENRPPLNEFTTQGLFELTVLLAEVRNLVNSLSRVSTSVERDPTQIIFGRSDEGVSVR